MATPIRARSLLLRQLRTPLHTTTSTASRRFASSHAHDASGPTSEGFGRSFYYTLLLIPSGYLMYSLSSSALSSPNGGIVGSAVKAYGDLQRDWTERNALHTRMVEQAGHDRNLFFNARSPNHIELKAPEIIFNGGSPYNVPAGHGVNLDKLAAHYKQLHAKEEEEKAARLVERREPRELGAKEGRSTYGSIVQERK